MSVDSSEWQSIAIKSERLDEMIDTTLHGLCTDKKHEILVIAYLKLRLSWEQ
jgi:hypothetical protein